jgi:hypothetical protein
MAVAANTFDLGSGPGPGSTRVPGIVIPAGEVWQRIIVAQILGRRGRVGIRIRNNGANPLTAMRLLRSMRPGGMAAEPDDVTILATDGEFAALGGTVEIQSVTPAAPHTLAPSAAADILLNAAGVAEYAVEIKSTLGTTVTVDVLAD